MSLAGAGQLGLGEIYLPNGALRSAAFNQVRASANLLASIDFRNINVALDAVSSVTDLDATTGPAVRAAFDVALHDLNGKLRGCPVHVMLGGSYRTEVAISRHYKSGTTVPQEGAGETSFCPIGIQSPAVAPSHKLWSDLDDRMADRGN